MISLEYIRNKISKKIKAINEKRNFMTNCKQMGIQFNSELTYEDEKEFEYLRQAEYELEAWESVKELIHNNNGVYLLRVDSDDEDDKEHYMRIEKALELDNNDWFRNN